MIHRIWAYAVVAPGSDRAAMLRQVADLGLTDLVVFVNGLDEAQFALPAAREAALAEAVAGLHRLGVAPHLVSWLRPTERYLTEAAARLHGLCTGWGVRSLQFDAEEPWTRHPLLRRGGERAAREFLDRHWTFDNWPCKLGVTGIAFLPPAVAPLAERCHYVLPQAYSVARAHPVYRPGATQRLAHQRWQRFGLAVVMGLAAWNLDRPGGIAQSEAMQRAIGATEALDGPVVKEVAYWSLRWIVASRERADFVRQACAKARRGVPQASASPDPGLRAGGAAMELA